MYSIAAACGDLASTGHLASAWHDSPSAAILIATLAAAGTGVLLLVLTRYRLGIQAVMAVILLVGIAPLGSVAQSPHAPKATTCTNRAQSVIITQTATITGMAPTVAPQRITGTVTNTSKKRIELGTMTASIGSVTMARSAAPGRCDASDYILLGPAMPMNVTVSPGMSAAFAGTMIGFLDKTGSNQDACKGAVVQLIYRLGASKWCRFPGSERRIIDAVNHRGAVSENRSQLLAVVTDYENSRPACRAQPARPTGKHGGEQ